jgi:hypothetical protein
MAKKTLTESLKEVLGKTEPTVVDQDTNQEVTVEEEVTSVDETAALDTLHPGSGSNGGTAPISRSEMISKAIGAMNVMDRDDLTHWFTSAIENSKHYSKATDGKADSNRDTLDMHPSHAKATTGPKTRDPMPKLGVKEDVQEALAGFELTEETQDKLVTIFEAAVTARVIAENARLEEEFEDKLDVAVTEISEDLSDQIDNYLTYVVEHFMAENAIAIESSLRNELMDEFINGLQGLFKEHFFTVPDNKVDVVEALSDKVADLESKFSEQLDMNKQLEEALVEVEREKLVDTYLEDLALSEADKFLKLVEGVDFDGDLDAYSQKLSVIKENYFGEKSKAPAKSNIVTESFEGDETDTVAIDPAIARYMDSINRVLQK